MSKKDINTDKKRFSKAEARYLLDRPWMTTPELRKQLLKLLEPEVKVNQDQGGEDVVQNQPTGSTQEE